MWRPTSGAVRSLRNRRFGHTPAQSRASTSVATGEQVNTPDRPAAGVPDPTLEEDRAAPTVNPDGLEEADLEVVGETTEALVTTGSDPRNRRANFTEMTQTQAGLIMFMAIGALFLVMLLAVGCFAWVTYPQQSEFEALARISPDLDPGAAVLAARDQWSSRVERVAQMCLFGSLVPLLATIIGYVLGERGRTASDTSAE